MVGDGLMPAEAGGEPEGRRKVGPFPLLTGIERRRCVHVHPGPPSCWHASQYTYADGHGEGRQMAGPTKPPAHRTVGDRSVLVTGATGFVGRHLVRTLGEMGGTAMRLFVRRGTIADLPEPARGVSTLIYGDLLDSDRVSTLCEDIDTVFHAAAMVGSRSSRGTNLDDFRRVNTDATLTLAAAAAAAGVRRFVFVSSLGSRRGTSGAGAAHRPGDRNSSPLRHRRRRSGGRRSPAVVPAVSQRSVSGLRRPP